MGINTEAEETSEIREVEITSSKQVVESVQRKVVFVVRCEELVKMDLIGRPDAYFIMSFEDTQIYSSPVVSDDATPVFEQVTIENIPFDIIIDFKFMDKALMKDDEIGQVSVSFGDIKDNGPLHEYPIIKGDKKRGIAFFAIANDEQIDIGIEQVEENAEEPTVEA